MKKNRLLPALLLLAVLLSSCSSSGGKSLSGGTPGVADSAPSSQPNTPGTGEYSEGYTPANPQAPNPQPEARSESKLILRADLSVESTEFDKAVATLDRLVSENGGYYESSSLRQGSYYSTGSARMGEYIIRVPQEKYASFLGTAGTVGHITSKNETAEDVGEAYYDTELRLKTQRSKHERLLSLLEKADSMETIIALQTALSEVEYEIEQLSGTLRQYDSLVGYATIHLQLNEVLTLTEQPKETARLSGRLANAFASGLRALGRNAGNLAVWAAYHFVGLVIFLAAATAVVLVLLKRHGKHRRKKNLPPPENRES